MELRLCPLQLLDNIAVRDSYVHHVVHPFCSLGDGLTETPNLSHGVLRLGTDGFALQVKKVTTDPLQFVVSHSYKHICITLDVFIELDVLEQVFEVVAFGYLLWAQLNPHLP